MANQSKKIKMLFLCTRLADYFYQCVKQLVIDSPVEAYIIRYPKDKNAPFKFLDTENIFLLNKKELGNREEFLDYVKNLSPDLIYSGGWSDKDYTYLCSQWHKKIPTVVGIDNAWEGNTRQYLGSFLMRRKLKRTFSNIWVTGIPQYEFARRLGYSHDSILKCLYSANTKTFQGAFPAAQEQRMKKYPKKMLYVGRYVAYKQPLLLAKVFDDLLKSGKTNGWSLEFIGEGPLKEELLKYSNEKITIKGFCDPADLPNEFAKSGAFCLPSKSEHWGVVVHEAAYVGVPLVLSKTTYAASTFLIENYNGFQFDENNEKELKEVLIKLFNKSEKELLQFSQKSFELSQLVTQEYWAANLMSIVN